MKDHFEAYGSLARSNASATVKAGRRNIQADAEKLVPDDIAQKLSITDGQSLLEIGCGPGALLRPLSLRVARAVGVDHPDVIEVAKGLSRDMPITFVAGRFPGVELSGDFDRILIYSVLQCQPDLGAALRFLDAAVDLLAPGGHMLIGDMPNADKMRRFRESEAGKRFEEEWKKLMVEELKKGNPHALFASIASLGTFDDRLILELLERYRARGYDAYLLPQKPELSHGHTREDILIIKP